MTTDVFAKSGMLDADSESIERQVAGILNSIVTLVCKREARVLVFDTETTAINGTVCELAYITYDEAGREIDSTSDLLQLLPGESVSNGAYGVHGIRDETLRREGKDVRDTLNKFADAVDGIREGGGMIVAHNAAFDVKRIAHTAQKCGLTRDTLTTFLPSLPAAVVCTMNRAAPHVNLQDVRGRRKRPRNDELYEFFFQSKPREDLHRALADVRVTAASFHAGKRKGWW